MTENKFGYPPHVERAVESRYSPICFSDKYALGERVVASKHVYKAVDTSTQDDVAVRFIPVDGVVGVRWNSQAAVRMVKEFDILSRTLMSINSPYVLPCKDLVYDAKLGIGIVTPWAQLGSFEKQLRRVVDNFDLVGSLGVQVALGLEELHRHHVVHRDLKPENIFVRPTEEREQFLQYQIGDFGLSAYKEYFNVERHRSGEPSIYGMQINDDADVWDERLTPVDSPLGTPSYMSPEQVRGLSFINEKTDLFSLGIVLYESLTGRHPFNAPYDTRATMWEIAHVRHHSLSDTLLGGRTPTPMQQSFFDIIDALLIKDVASRGERWGKQKLETAGDVAKAIAECWTNAIGSPFTQTQEFKVASQRVYSTKTT